MTRPNQERSINISAPSSGPDANAIQFDGAAYAKRTGTLLTSANSTTMLCSFFFDIGSLADGTIAYLFSSDSVVIAIERRDTNNKFRISGRNSGSSSILVFVVDTVFTQTLNTGWHHIICWGDTADGTVHVYTDGVEDDGGSVNAGTSGEIDWTRTAWAYGGRGQDGVAPWYGKSSNVVLESDPAKLASIIATSAPLEVVAMFRNSDGSVRTYDNESNYPYGEHGERPLGFQPLVYMADPADTFEVNKGRGGALIEITSGVTDVSPP